MITALEINSEKYVLFARKTMSNKIHEYFDTAYSQWNIRDFLDKCDLEPLGQKTDCYVRCLKTIANRETDRRREKAQELLDRFRAESRSLCWSVYDLRGRLTFKVTSRSDTGPAGAYTTYEGTRPDRQLARSWDKERSYKNKSAEPSVHVHHPTFIGGGTVSGIINSETFISGSSEKDQKKAQDPVDNISAFFKDPSGVKVEYESRNSPSVSDDDDSNYMPSDTDESASDTDASEDNINGKDLPKLTRRLFTWTMNTLFTDKEWSELIKDRNVVPSVPRDIAEELSKYGSKTLKELRTKVMKSYLKDDEEYDVQKHYNREWIQMTMRTLCNLFENIDTPLVRTQYEDWFTVALFGTCIDFCVRDAQLGTDIKGTDAPSLSSANRKNRRRKANARKLIGRKIDGIIYITNRLVEIGAIEGARAFGGVSDNKYLLESFKMPKTLRDMYSDLIKAVNYDDQKADKLQIIIRNNLQILNILNDDTDTESGDLLEELLKDDNEQCSTPPPVPIHFFADCENTPKKKKEKKD
ncbi:1620_t:CDS:10 [Diversispora eburnea]|uniref:1620_t:CDS:1 n=1 Tax=Diversispora eburnea TaxID=1213867 RepID=A0A9N9BWT0_9GLOM|nr:1620_t:CDS:10 [Diversispora eburnea]